MRVLCHRLMTLHWHHQHHLSKMFLFLLWKLAQRKTIAKSRAKCTPRTGIISIIDQRFFWKPARRNTIAKSSSKCSKLCFFWPAFRASSASFCQKFILPNLKPVPLISELSRTSRQCHHRPNDAIKANAGIYACIGALLECP